MERTGRLTVTAYATVSPVHVQLETFSVFFCAKCQKKEKVLVIMNFVKSDFGFVESWNAHL